MLYVHGIKVICTAHGNSIEGVKQNKNLKKMVDLNFFERIIFLKEDGVRGSIEKIYEVN